MEPVIRNISDTSLWVAIYRAEETERPDAVFKDPFARKLAGERGLRIMNAMPSGRKNTWSFIARTWLIDEFVKEHVQEGYELVLNLASGLDTRAFRMDLPADLIWIDADMPEISDYMTEQMQEYKPVCRHERVAIDLSDRKARIDFYRSVSERKKKTLVITEGLLVYLSDEDAGAFAFDLSHTPGFSRWIIDLMSPATLPFVHQETGAFLAEANSPLKFAPEEGEDFFRLFGWKPKKTCSRLQTAYKLNRLPDELKQFGAMPEFPGTRRPFPWGGICLFENGV